MFSSPFSSRSKSESHELKLLQDQIKSLQEMYIGACEARDDLQENMQSLKSSLKLKADEAEHSGARVRELEVHTSQLTQRLRDATDLLERRGVAERAARDELRRLETQHSQGANTYLEQLDTLRLQIRDAEEALQKRQQEYDSVRRQLGVTERVSEAGMAQIRQLASLLSQQQQQVFPPFLSQLQSPAHRALPPASPSQSGAASCASAAVVGRRGGDAKDGPGQCSASARAVAAVCLDDTPQLGGAVGVAAPEASSGAQQPATPGHRSHTGTPRSQSPALAPDDDEDAEGEEPQQNVSGSSDGSDGES